MNVAAIQQALRDEKLDGWLFFDHHFRDPLAYRILDLTAPRTPTPASPVPRYGRLSVSAPTQRARRYRARF